MRLLLALAAITCLLGASNASAHTIQGVGCRIYLVNYQGKYRTDNDIRYAKRHLSATKWKWGSGRRLHAHVYSQYAWFYVPLFGWNRQRFLCWMANPASYYISDAWVTDPQG